MATDKPAESLRREYTGREITIRSMSADPFVQFREWYRDAEANEVVEANAMCLGTVSPDGIPSSRIVLLKGFGNDGFVFFTNYESRKARELEEAGNVSLLFFWPAMSRQVRICGSGSRTSREESATYFASRPRGSQLSAWTSRQSSEVETREELVREYNKLKLKYDGQEIPCPPFWGGFRVIPDTFEFWQGQPDRLHDRIAYSRQNDSWDVKRLSP